MRKTLVAGNWKMNGSRSSIEELMTGVIGGAAAANADMLVCPPYVYLEQVRAAAAGTSRCLFRPTVLSSVQFQSNEDHTSDGTARPALAARRINPEPHPISSTGC